LTIILNQALLLRIFESRNAGARVIAIEIAETEATESNITIGRVGAESEAIGPGVFPAEMPDIAT